MNLPNKLTLLRILLIPVFLWFLLSGVKPYHFLVALIIFILACTTDFLDGHLARKNNIVTSFGKLMDPLADKLLVMSAMVCFVEFGLVSAWVVVVILAREFLVTSIRLIAASNGTVLAADRWGKFKTVSQMIWIIWTLFTCFISVTEIFSDLSVFIVIMSILMWITLALTVFSGINYCVKNPQVFSGRK